MNTNDKSGTFIVLECHGGPEYAIVVTDEDGNNKVFDSYNDALTESNDCQDGMIIQLG